MVGHGLHNAILCPIPCRTMVWLCLAKGLASSPRVSLFQTYYTSKLWNSQITLMSNFHFQLVYVTALFPYFVLILFFCRGVTLEGMSDGILHLFTPKVLMISKDYWLSLTWATFNLLFKWEKLKDPVVWLEAGTQIFFSLGLGFGGLIAFASYNPVNNNCKKDAM